MILVVVLALAGASGLTAPTPLDEVKQLDALMPDLLKSGPKLTALLTTAAEMRGELIALGVGPKDIDNMMKRALADQAPQPNQPSSFAAVEAIVETKQSEHDTVSHNVTLFDAKGQRAGVQLYRRGDGTFALWGPAFVDEGTYDGEMKFKTAADRPLHFVKKGGAWEFVAPVAPPPPDCNDRIKALAKRAYVGEEAYRAELDKYSQKLDDLGVEVPKGAKVVVKQASADKFLAEVSLEGGTATIDQANTFTVVKQCKTAGKAKK